ncbi:Dda.1 hypothetical protein [Escherichia phage JS10]|uniref:Uncharacterized protein dda.1 n=4 Tax=Dhakavirus TaxID=1914165 RepID=C4MZA9_9CAUD|nr:Dda.1 hypothetical protein [Escherichia phage JS98]YP_002922363.1 Dda.1 hypothetical protein [Escherichia phage JS10]YP_010094406.1 hypothetical protein KNT84_gp263 [Enterobacteria phage vB_EcoM_IME281]QAY00043.1 hypothetical protein EcWhh1_110 [Escherichia phage EcWhh-1]QIN95959.1 hypothetical protein MN04_00170 [Escherichia phage MN04]CAI9866029.1 hypothetical protein PFGHJN_00271 [Escherichia phage UP19]ABX11040.1 Dda.1 hypothetical protein [Escherichia phage JS98]ACL78240.1 Dda.1 hypo
MYYAYVLVHKDKDGYEIPLEDAGEVTLYSTKIGADTALEAYEISTKRYLRLGRLETVCTPRKWWFDKWETKTVFPTKERARELKLILDTLYVKRVKLA